MKDILAYENQKQVREFWLENEMVRSRLVSVLIQLKRKYGLEKERLLNSKKGEKIVSFQECKEKCEQLDQEFKEVRDLLIYNEIYCEQLDQLLAYHDYSYEKPQSKKKSFR